MMLEATGLWIGLIVSWLMFSLLWGDRGPTRLMQYLLVGATTGWIGIYVWDALVQPRLVGPWLRGDFTATGLVSSAALAILALGALVRPRAQEGRSPLWGRVVVGLASLISSFLVASAIATGFWGIWRGTLVPQAITAVTTAYWLPIALVITLSVLLHLTLSADFVRQLPPRTAAAAETLTRVGHSLLMLASGMVLARLISSRITLLTAFLEETLIAVQTLGLDEWLRNLMP